MRVETKSWTSLPVKLIGPRSGHKAVVVDTFMAIHGGKDQSGSLQDVFMFDLGLDNFYIFFSSLLYFFFFLVFFFQFCFLCFVAKLEFSCVVCDVICCAKDTCFFGLIF